MKAILFAVLVGIVGCVPSAGTGAQLPEPQDDAQPTTVEDNSPRFVTPVDGSSTGPVLATPMGGMYLPVDGGPPIMAI